MTMPTATTDNFVGLFGRQAPIGLDIPQWVTVYVPHGAWQKQEVGGTVGGFMAVLVEGLAVIGLTGVTIVIDENVKTWSMHSLNDLGATLKGAVAPSRPYFRIIVSNVAAALENDGATMSGPLLVVTNGEAVAVPEAVLRGGDAICVDVATTMVAKTTHPYELSKDAIQELGVKDLYKQPQWAEKWSRTVLRSTTALMALNVLAKPERFGMNRFFFACDFLDETIMQAVNARGVRPRFRDEKKTRTKKTKDAAAVQPDPPTDGPAPASAAGMGEAILEAASVVFGTDHVRQTADFLQMFADQINTQPQFA
jgi:hypothetical protein